MKVQATNTQYIGINKHELKGQAIKELGVIFRNVRKFKPNDKKLTRMVARETSRCTKDYRKMEKVVRETKQMIGNELENIAKNREQLKIALWEEHQKNMQLIR
jgi:hypothetical protein